MKKPSSTMVDIIVMASKLPLIKVGTLLRISKPNTTNTTLMYVVLLIIFLYFNNSTAVISSEFTDILTIVPSFAR